jgi:hypothetical protein
MRVTTYIYPDGTKGIRKPRDGEIFRSLGQCRQQRELFGSGMDIKNNGV